MSSIQDPVSSIQKMRKHQEKQLVIHCARTHMDEKRINSVRRLLEDGNLDWNYIMGNPSFYRISPLLFRNLKEIAVENAVPQSVMDALAARYALTLYQNMLICDQLCEVLERLKGEGIPVILLKGFALAETVYSDMALRPMADIDILVKKADLEPVAEILSNLGYTQSFSGYSMDFWETHHHIAPYRKLVRELNEPIMIEVHRNVASEPSMSRINVDRLWERTQTLNISGIDVFTLSPENLILNLCVHLSHRAFVGGILTLVDISESVRFYANHLNWHSFVESSNEFGMGNSVYYPLYLAKELMDSNIPPYVFDTLKLKPQLNSFETTLLRLLTRKNILRIQDLSFFPDIITFFYGLLCREFLFTSGIGNRFGNSVSKCMCALRKAI